MKTNTKTKKVVKKVYTAPGAIADNIDFEQQLRRSVLTHLLWEDIAYEDGESITQRISKLVPKVQAKKVAALAVECREEQKLRHVPLFLVREMARHDSHKGFVALTLEKVIQRADELSEFVSIYWKDGKQPLSKQVKKGLALAFNKFDEYALAKYNSDKDVKLRDVLFLCHAKPKNKAQEKLWKKLINDKLKTPDTWENELMAGKGNDKKGSWERLLKEEKLGALAFLRNLRNMEEAGVDNKLIKKGFESLDVSRVLPFRFVAAANHAPRWEAQLESLMLRCLENQEKLSGKTVLVVDISGSMESQLSARSDLNRLDAACSLAMLVREVCEEPVIYATAGCDHRQIHATDVVAARRGFALREAIKQKNEKLGGGGIFLNQVMDYIQKGEASADRVIVITDEQDCDHKANPQHAKAFGKNNYIINISSNKNGIAYKKFTHINGWSESVLDFIQAIER